MKNRQSDQVTVWDRASRRRFIRTGAGFLLAGGAVVGTGSAQAADCDQYARNGQAADQDSGENADRKDCTGRNIVSQAQPLRKTLVRVARIKA